MAPGDRRGNMLVPEFRRQADACRSTSPLYGALLDSAADDAEAGGPTAALVAPYDDPDADVPGLRLLAAVHRLVLTDRVPELAAYYPSVGGTAPSEEAWPAFRDVLVRHADELATLVAQPVQTNEPGRSAVLMGVLLTVAHRTGLPVRLLEVGASGGLNLRGDRFAYRVGDATLGDPAAPLVLDQPWRGRPPAPLDTGVRVVERRGCDPYPVDAGTAEGRLRLLSLVWPVPERFARIRAALDVAARVPATVDAAPAEDWLPDRLARPAEGAATLVWHSVVRQYVPAPAWARIQETIATAGAAATARAPLAYAAFEPVPRTDRFEVRLTTWPDGAAALLGTAHPHGPPVHWSDPSA